MKSHEQWQDEVLLAASGELSLRRRRALQKVLARDADLRAFADQLQVLQSRHLSLSDEELQVSPFALNQIRDEATRQLAGQSDRRRAPYAGTRSPWAMWRPALLYGTISALLLLFGFRFVVQPPTTPVGTPDNGWALLDWNAQFDEELDELLVGLTQLAAQIDDWHIWLNEDLENEWALELLQRRQSS